MHALGLSPSPKWDGKKSPKGARKDRPSYFWEWRNYHTLGTHTGAKVGILVLDIDEPAKFRKWIEKFGTAEREALAGCMISHHRDSGPEAVRSGGARGKLIFKFEADENHPLARIGQAALKSDLGCEVFFGSGAPTVLGAHPDGPEREYLIAGVLGPPPDWLINDLVGRAAKKQEGRGKQATSASGGNGTPAGAAPNRRL